jgi:hypothetical protein
VDAALSVIRTEVVVRLSQARDECAGIGTMTELEWMLDLLGEASATPEPPRVFDDPDEAAEYLMSGRDDQEQP